MTVKSLTYEFECHALPNDSWDRLQHPTATQVYMMCVCVCEYHALASYAILLLYYLTLLWIERCSGEERALFHIGKAPLYSCFVPHLRLSTTVYEAQWDQEGAYVWRLCLLWVCNVTGWAVVECSLKPDVRWDFRNLVLCWLTPYVCIEYDVQTKLYDNTVLKHSVQALQTALSMNNFK